MKVVVISGPTASGKTSLSIELAKKFHGEVVNFDSLLLYKEITIGTAKPTSEEMDGVPHHMIAVRSISDAMNAADYFREAKPLVDSLLSQGKTVFLVGGSGFYLQALLKGMYESETTPPEIQERSNNLYQEQGIKPFIEFIKEHDKDSYERYHENDHYRIRRAVEHFWTTGSPLSVARTQKDLANIEMNSQSIHQWEVLHIYLDIPKDEHFKIIQQRTNKMIQDGLVEEVKSLLLNGFTGKEKPLQSIGYFETLEYLQGGFSTLEDFKERISISTRQLAKSQRTWFNREKQKLSFHPIKDRELIIENVSLFLGK